MYSEQNLDCFIHCHMTINSIFLNFDLDALQIGTHYYISDFYKN